MSLWRKNQVVFDDLRFPLIGQRLTTSAGRLDFNFIECTVDFSATARYPEEPICMIAQMSHRKKMGTSIRPHIHWVQKEDYIPNWLIAYRFYNNGGIVPSTLTLAKHTGVDFTYTTGSILQISDFPHISAPAGETVSSICDVILYRDSQNVSGLFTGVDPYSATVQAKEFDFHFEIDSDGSTQEYSK